LGRTFSLELKSKDYLEKINIQEGQDGVLFEGSLGELEELLLLEDSLMELKGSYGVLRFEITRDEVFSLLNTETVQIYE
jgi:hypothetical protein